MLATIPAVTALSISAVHADPNKIIDEDVVSDLMRSMETLGLRTPITVAARADGRFDLIAGQHRFAASQRLGFTDIQAFVVDDDSDNAKRWQISENLHRKHLTALEHAEQVAAWVKLTPIDGQVVPKLRVGRPEGAIKRAAAKLPIAGKTEQARVKAVRRSLQIASIVDAAKAATKAAGLDDNQAALLEIAAQSTEQSQLAKVAELTLASVPALAPMTEVVSADHREGTLQHLIDRGYTCDVAVLTPTPADIATFRREYADPEELTRKLPLHRVLARSSAVIVVARVSDTPTIASLVKATCGLKDALHPRIVLTQEPKSPDVTAAQSMLIVERGRPRRIELARDSWTSGEARPLELAAQMYPEAKHKLQAFAQNEADGWTNLSGSNTWVEGVAS